MEDEALALHLVEWGLLSQAEVAEARELQKRLARTGKAAPLDEIIVAHSFLSRQQLDEALSAVELPPPEDDLPADVAAAQKNPDARFGHFLLLGEVGRGGLGIVQRAWDLETRRIVAIKFLKTEGSVDPDRAAELLMEGSRLSRLRHPNIITVHEFGQIRDRFFYSMELLEGMGLDQLIRASRTRGRFSPFYDDPKRYLRVLRDIARAVHYLHTRNPVVVHCDLKPANILVDFAWRPYLVDFGLARELKDGKLVDLSGQIRGSPSYMAPEQVMGKLGEVDVRTDVYGLGAILYELLSGRPPYAGEIQTVLDQNLLVDPPAPSKVVAARVAISSSSGPQPTVPPEVEAVCLKCIAKEKKDRYPAARAVVEAIDPLVADKPLRVKTPTQKMIVPEALRKGTGRFKPSPRKRRWGVVAGVVAGLAAGTVAISFMMGGDDDPKIIGGPTDETQRRIYEIRYKVDELSARLDVDAALDACHKFAGQNHEQAAQDWFNGAMEEVDCLRSFRSGLAETLTRERPTIPTLKLRAGGFKHVTVSEASFASLSAFVDHRGDAEEIRWGEIHPDALLEVARKWPASFTSRARVGQALYAARNGEKTEALRLLEGMNEEGAIRILDRLKQRN